MSSFYRVNGFCYLSLLLLISSQLVLVPKAEAEAQSGQSNEVYIVYTGAASLASSNGFHSDHIMSSSSIKSWKDRIIHKYNHAFSGFAARLSEEEAKLIAQRPEVVSVFPDRIHRLHTTRSWDFLMEQSAGFAPARQNIPKSNVSSLSDEDVIIGIFDTGIWPEAKSFNDDGLGPIPKKWKGQCIGGHDFKPFNCNRKLIGARNYVTNGSSTSPRDHNGHGTHVAAIAAGRPVPGASYHGLATGVARGGAPGARIAAYRVCDDDDNCMSSIVLKAFDDAIADGVDIISISFGSLEFIDFTRDPVSIGAFHAVENGILVVGSAGDNALDEEPPYAINVAPWILTVGATTIDRFFESDVVLGGKQVIKGGGVHSAKLKETPIYPLTYGKSAAKPGASISDAYNCMIDALDGKKVKGKIVLCEDSREETTPAKQLEVIKRLGGTALIYRKRFIQLAASVSDSIPRIPISWDDGDLVVSYIDSNRNPVATILPTVVVPNYKPAPEVAFFSSPGGGALYGYNYFIKPDIVAPGVDILSAWPSNETNEAFNILSGTSMACPHVSGVAALVKSRYPSWSPSAIKSALMTSANPTNNLKKPIATFIGDAGDPTEMGAGQVTLTGPLQPGLIYETEAADYILFLCNQGYNVSRIRLISSKLPANFSCPSNSSTEDYSANMNYPSITVTNFNSLKEKTVKRTVTNVGDDEEAAYVASVEMGSTNNDVIARVNPTKLVFTKNQKKLGYEMTFIHNSSAIVNGYAFGSVTWRNGKILEKHPLENWSFSMKYLEYTPLDRINDFLSQVNLGERTIKGCLEAYSCKHTGTDKKLSLSLESEILDYLGKSSDTDSPSPVEYLPTSSRRTLIYLLLTLYHIYPDYDFSAVNAHQFFNEETWDSFKQIFDVYMFEASKEWLETNEGCTLLEILYKALDEVVKLAECEIYSYNAEADADPSLERGAIWSYHFFFYNRKLKRVVSFRFSCLSNLAVESFLADGMSYDDADDEIFDGMDI
ncbi:OLC1v1032139C1 [Oldenlandia corymbosa var. corymbosa]|uniref:OLC1v1032139C1 n=1 Tax=Oldenlandia corymbosa var. corymbosa TaxID=529605 RepID=A0AAV1CKI7_OLDCO|nr:OLC1v1032139C1 [Oldenlandia corymbosa var. corymbosa]